MSKRKSDRTPEELEAHRKKHREYMRRYLLEHPEKAEQIRKTKAKWKKNNPDKVAANSKSDRKARKDRILAYQRQWRRANRTKVNAYEARRLGRPASRTSDSTPIGEAFQKALSMNLLYAAAMAAVPRTLPLHVRDDAIQSIVVAVLAGEFCQDEIPLNAKRIIASEWGLMDRREYTSLDDVVPGMDDVRHIDLLTSDTPHF